MRQLADYVCDNMELVGDVGNTTCVPSNSIQEGQVSNVACMKDEFIGIPIRRTTVGAVTSS